ncbi:MAG TPA: heavy metal translocating P-type ATPase, partial [Candidatus Acutalibacter stercoravium]|nr:heavy metal translocating P-type ATPase [Candidatus Acutalibacter stercoravium]
MKTEKYNVTGMTCAACQANVTRCVSKLEGVADVNVSLLANQMTVSYDESKVGEEDIVQAVEKIGYGASSLERQTASPSKGGFRSEWQARQDQALNGQKQMKRRLISSIVLLVPLMYIAMGGMMGLPVPWFFVGMENSLVNALAQLLLTIPVLFINRHFFQTGFKALWHRAPNMDSLVAIGSGASLVYGLFAMFRLAYGFGHGDMGLVHEYAHALYFESSAMILTLVTVGKYLEARSKSKTGDALGKLVDLAPKTAVVLRSGVEQTIPAEQVAAGDIVVIRPGEGIPVDGVVTEGHGYVDQAAITGESIPVEKGPGDSVISATINKNGTFQFRASKVGEDTTLSQIIRLVDEASNSKAPIARLADKVSGVFVPVVIAIAIVTAIVWLIAGMGFEFALSNAISVLVISCPCALGLATPVAIMVGTGKAAEMGILIKSAESLENLHNVDTIVLDKTGTITSGHPAVTDILPMDRSLTAEQFLAEAAAAELGSEHPLAQAVVERARQLGLSLPKAEAFEAVAGRGIHARVQGREYLAGNLAFLEENHLPATAEERSAARAAADQLAREGKTPLLFLRDGRLLGVIAVADTIRETSRAAIRRFSEMGLRVVMLTGDNKVTAEAIRKELGIEQAISDVLPTQKEAHIRALQEEGHKVAMVG